MHDTSFADNMFLSAGDATQGELKLYFLYATLG